MTLIEKASLRTPSVLSLIVVNISLLVAAIILNWSAYEMVLAYWIENLVIGVYFILKIGYTLFSKNENANPLIYPLGFFFIAFFCVHYGAFCFGHGAFIVALLGQETVGEGLISGVLEAIDPVLFWITFILMMISHGVSFKTRFIDGKEAHIRSGSEMMFAPYKRIILVHVFIMLCGFLFIYFGFENFVFMTLFVLMKVAVDLRQHLKEHTTKPIVD